MAETERLVVEVKGHGEAVVAVIPFDGKGEPTYQQARAWANLFEAAPKMLAALKWAATVIRPGSDLHNDMTAAIAEAEGVAAA